MKQRGSFGVFCGVLVIGVLLGVGCDQGKYDFDCEGTWGRGDKELSKKKYRYEQLTSEQEAVRLCSQDMMKDRPKGGKAAKCECKGE
jgi:hypothetical protein